MTLDSLKQYCQKHLVPLSMSFTAKAKEVIKQVDAWARHQTTNRLQELVDTVYQLKQIGDIQTLLNSIPNRVMGPSSRSNLYNIVSKVARYREAARFLVRTARKWDLVRRMSIVLVDLPLKYFQRASATHYAPKFATTIARIRQVGRKEDLSHICRLLGLTCEDAESRFTSLTQKTLMDSKIHAEIQLLAYCDMNFTSVPPRVVCSSKDACFLCNAFIQLHGKMHMPRNHGRLYPGWRLPPIPEFVFLENQFNAMLEDRIRTSLSMLLTRGRKSNYPDPNESTLLTLPHSASTLRALPSLVGTTEHTEESGYGVGKHVQHASASLTILVPGSPPLSNTTSTSNPTTEAEKTQEEAESTYNKTNPPPQPPPHTPSQPPSPKINTASHQPSPKDNDATPDPHDLRSLSTRTPKRLEIFIEAPSSSNQQEFQYRVDYLNHDDANEVRKSKAAFIIDAEALDTEMLREMDDNRSVYIATRGAVVKVGFDVGVLNEIKR